MEEETKSEVTTVQEEVQVEQPKRTRRTKAEIEAERAASSEDGVEVKEFEEGGKTWRKTTKNGSTVKIEEVLK